MNTVRICFSRCKHSCLQWVFNPLKPAAALPVSHPTINQLCTSTEKGLSPSAKNRVLSLLAQYQEGPSFRKSQSHSLHRVKEWVESASDGPELSSSTHHFLFHVCVDRGSSEDIQLAVDLAKRYGVELTDRELNMILAGLSVSGGLEQVKETLREMKENGMKVRLNTQTSVLQRAVNERDVPLALEAIDLMNGDGNFPSSSTVITDALRVWAGAHSCDGVEVVRGVMGLHNNQSQSGKKRHEVDKATATAFMEWIKSLPFHSHSSLPKEYSLNKTVVSERGVCGSCGEQLAMNELTKEEHEVLLHHFEEEMGYEIGKGERARLERKKAKELVSLMEKTRYSAIVDGLNVAYHLSRSRRDHVLAVSKMLVEKTGREVLVFGRPHFTKFRARKYRDMEAVHRHYGDHGVHLFILNERSRDDRYFMYAALACNCLLVSNDKFGDTVHGEDWNKKCLFTKWLRGKAVNFTISKDYISLQYPTACDRVVQWSEDSWHLPLDTSNWLCAHVPH